MKWSVSLSRQNSAITEVCYRAVHRKVVYRSFYPKVQSVAMSMCGVLELNTMCIALALAQLNNECQMAAPPLGVFVLGG